MPDRPISPPPEKMVLELRTPNNRDGFFSQLVSRESVIFLQNEPIKRGTLYSTLKGAEDHVIADYPTLFFCKELRPGNISDFGSTDAWVIWLWATEETAESAYNSEITYEGGDINYPKFTRVYTTKRDLWEADQTVTPLTVLSALLGIEITAGGTGYTTATATVGGAGTGAVIELLLAGGSVIGGIITSEGTGHIPGTTTITISGDGTGATATPIIQPLTSLLVDQAKQELPSDSQLSHEFVRVLRTYETLPGRIRRSDEWDEEARVMMSTFRRRVASTFTTADLPVVGSTYSTGSIMGHNSIASLSILDPGTDYTSIPTLAIEASPGGGTQATASVTSLKVVAAQIGNPGSGYAIGNTLTVSGGTGTAATLTVAFATLTGIAVNAPGSGYVQAQSIVLYGGTPASGAAIVSVVTTGLASLTVVNGGSDYNIGDDITLTGGTFTTAAVVRVATVGLESTTLLAAGSGFNPNDVITLASGTFTLAAQVTVTTVEVVGGTVNAGGSLYAPGDSITMTGAGATVDVVVSVISVDGGGAVTDYSISNGGSFNAAAGTLTQVSTTGTGTGFELIPTCGVETFNVTRAGVYSVTPATLTTGSVSPAGGGSATFNTSVWEAVSVTVQTPGSYTVNTDAPTQASVSPAGGTGITFSGALYGVGTVEIDNGGDYSATSTTFTQDSTSGDGVGVTFNSATFGVSGLTVATGGAYTVIPGSPASVTGGAGTGMTVVLNFGIGAVSLTNAGTLYYSNSPLVTVSTGNARIVSVSDSVVVIPNLTAYVRDTALLDTDNANIKEAVWVVSPTPPTVTIYYREWVNLPRRLYSVTHNYYCNGTSNFTLTTNTVEDGAEARICWHRKSFIYTESEPPIVAFTGWKTRNIRYDGKVVSLSFPNVLNNRLYYQQNFSLTDGGCEWTETYNFPATIPSASGFAGRFYTISSPTKPWRGNAFLTVKEDFLAPS